MITPKNDSNETSRQDWKHSTHQAFYDYYRDESISTQALERFKSIRKTVLTIISKDIESKTAFRLDVADIGCGAGTQCMLWSELGHRTHGIDVNSPLIELARERSARNGIQAEYQVGSATALPWNDSSMDVCLMPELLEHVPEWHLCLDECTRILRPNGILFLTTTNKLSPIQEEFNLPLYSWYPAPLKRYCVRLATSTKPGIAGYATYPAVNWFTFSQLKDELTARGFDVKDKFQTIETENAGFIKKALVTTIQKIYPLRWLAIAVTPYTSIIAIKQPNSGN